MRRILALVAAMLGVLASGLLLSAVPALALEAPITRQATSIKGTETGVSATLNGELNPNASATAGYQFEYNTGSLTCEGGQTTSTGPEQTGRAIPVSKVVPALEGNTEYTFCAQATSPTETLTGLPSTFLTPAIPPVVMSESAGVAPFGATLEAQVNPENLPSTSCVFEYGSTAPGYGQSVPCSLIGVQGASPTGVSASVGSLTPKTIYHFRVVVGNESGPVRDGADAQFETAELVKPRVESESAGNVTPFAVMLHAKVNPESQTSSCKFVYDTNEAKVKAGEGTEVACVPGTLEGGSGVDVEGVVKGLNPGKKYFYRVLATNATGKGEGAVEEFTTLEAKKPRMGYHEVIGLSPFDVVIEGIVNPEYQETSCEVVYGSEQAKVQAGEGTKVACSLPQLGSGGSFVTVRATLHEGVRAGQPLYYRVLAVNATGAGENTAEEVAVPALGKPRVESLSAPNVTPYEAQLETLVNPVYEETSCKFVYGTEKAKAEKGEGTEVACSPAQLGEGAGGVSAKALLSGLTPGKTYYYSVIAKNAEGVSSKVEEFKTPPAGVPQVLIAFVPTEASVLATQADIEAFLTGEYQATSVQVEYSISEEAVLHGTATKSAAVKLPAATLATEAFQLANVQVGAGAGEAPLQPGEIYYYRVIATNEAGTSVPTAISTFRTLPAATFMLDAAQNVGTDTATITGSVDPEGVETTYHFAYIDQTRYEQALALGAVFDRRLVDPAIDPYANGFSTPEVSEIEINGAPRKLNERHAYQTPPVTLTNLEPGTTYHYALVATSSKTVVVEEKPVVITTTTIGASGTFTTQSTPATVGEMSVSEITQSAAKIEGSVNGAGLPTRWEIQLGQTPGVLQRAASGNNEGAPVRVFLHTVSLSPGTSYYYKLIAVNPDGTVETPEGSFTTAPPPPPPVLAVTPLLTAPHYAFPEEEKITTTSPKKKAAKCPKGKQRNSHGKCVKVKNKKKKAKKASRDLRAKS